MSLFDSQLRKLLEQLKTLELLENLDTQLCHWLHKQLPKSTPCQLLLAAIVSDRLNKGHVCVNLQAVEDSIDHWPDALFLQARHILAPLSADVCLVDHQIIGDGSTLTPLVLDQQRLYFYRYWQYECKVAQRFINALGSTEQTLCAETLTAQLDKYFGAQQQADWQRVAVAIAVNQKITVISGGPGTGKTTTVTKLLAIYIESQLALGRKPIIALAAPTGKAAARISQSIAQAKESLDIGPEVLALIPQKGKTLHRLLGARANSKKYIHHADNPLLLDLLIIDEASMIDLPMMASIVDALSSGTRMILIGDRDQLASVEAGSVLGDICASPQPAHYSVAQSALLAKTCGFKSTEISDYPFSDQLAILYKSYRFAHDSGIGALAKACNQGDELAVEQVLEHGYSDLRMIPITQNSHQVLAEVIQGYRHYINLMRSSTNPQELLSCFNQYQVLCALRVSDFGIESINLQLEQYFEKEQLKEANNRWYQGRAVMVTRNDNQMQLYNGDIGIACVDVATGLFKVWFEQAGELRSVLPSRLPSHETVFAMTVHKSQGSEFDHVMLVLAKNSKVVNRELIYTAITRAKSTFSFLGMPSVLKQAVKVATMRASGLGLRIWQKKSAE